MLLFLCLFIATLGSDDLPTMPHFDQHEEMNAYMNRIGQDASQIPQQLRNLPYLTNLDYSDSSASQGSAKTLRQEKSSMIERTTTDSKIIVDMTTFPIIIDKAGGVPTLNYLGNNTLHNMELWMVFFPTPYGISSKIDIGFEIDSQGNLRFNVIVISYYGVVWYREINPLATHTTFGQHAFKVSVPVGSPVGVEFTRIRGYTNDKLNVYDILGLAGITFQVEQTVGAIQLTSRYSGPLACNAFPQSHDEWSNLHAENLAYIPYTLPMSYVSYHMDPNYPVGCGVGWATGTTGYANMTLDQSV